MFWYGDAYCPNGLPPTRPFPHRGKEQGIRGAGTVLSRWVQFHPRLARELAAHESQPRILPYSMVDLQQAYRLYTLALSGNAELCHEPLAELPNLSFRAGGDWPPPTR